MVKNLACFFLLSALPLSTSAQPAGFVPAWLNDGSPVSDADLDAIVKNVGAQQANPDHIVFLVHGLGNSREASTSQFNALAPLLAKQYQQANKKVVIVGLQWNSDVPLGLFTAEANYLDMLARARKVGHWPARQLMLKLQKQYPKANFDIYAHSLGCEVTAATIVPEITYTDDIPKSEAFQPAQDIHSSMITMAGSDLDFDVWSKSHVTARADAPRAKELWMTMSPYLGEKEQDETLKMRAMVRGVAAGSAFPKMTEQQYDNFLGNQRLVVDNQNIPADHAFLKYYDEARLARVVPLAVHVGDPKFPKPKEFAELDVVKALPDQVSALTPYLDSPNLTTVMYTLWRLEKIDCGGSKHLADGTIEEMARRMKNKPATVRSGRKDSPCKTMSSGYFPTEDQLTRAGAPNW